MNPFAFIFEVLASLMSLVRKTTKVLETNIDSLQEISEVGNTIAKSYKAEAMIELNKKLDQI